MKNTSVSDQIDLSVILPVFNEKEALNEMFTELVTELNKTKLKYEVIFVCTPGKIDSYTRLKNIVSDYKNVFVVNIKSHKSGGFQKGYQYYLGFKLARGNYVIHMDSDYQDDPIDIPGFIEKLNAGYDLVVGWKQNRKDPGFYKFTSYMHNFIFRLVTGINIHDKNCGFKAYSRVAVDSLRLHGQNFRDIPLQLSAKKFKVTEIPIHHRFRQGGIQTFKFFNRLCGGTIDFLADLIVTKMGDKPFQFLGGTGILALISSISMLLVFTMGLLVLGNNMEFNWWTVLWIIVMLMLWSTGIILIATGAMMEYKIFTENFSIGDYGIISDPDSIIQKRLG